MQILHGVEFELSQKREILDWGNCSIISPTGPDIAPPLTNLLGAQITLPSSLMVRAGAQCDATAHHRRSLFHSL